MSDKIMVISEKMQPEKRIERVKGDYGEDVLLRYEAMFTAYKHSAGEFSEFFIALADSGVILGKVCPSCGVINCPPYQARCPECNFIEMVSIKMKDVGIMVATPVVTISPPARFKNEVPFCTGYIYLESERQADTAIPLRVRTTQGMMRRGILGKGTPVKVVFKDKREGEITDLFVVSQAELTREQIEKSPLLEGDLEWEKPQEPDFEDGSAAMHDLSAVFKKFLDLAYRVRNSASARKDLINWKRTVDIKTAGNQRIRLKINNGELHVNVDQTAYRDCPADLVLALADPTDLFPYLERGVALTNLVLSGKLWVSKPELETITRLDRLPRSLRKDGV